jgi:signal transduction histidine kinase
MHLIHDLRLVLISLAACLTALHRRSQPSPPRELDEASRLLDTGLALLNELLVNRTLKPIAPHADVNLLLHEFAAILSTVVGPDIDVRVKLGAGDTRIYAQPVDVERIVLNIALNAATAMPSGGSLQIETEVIANPASSPAGHVQLTIRDTGHGMSERELARAIDPYAQPTLDGRGIGLASVALILTRLGGRLAIESRRDHGTLVTILFPLADGRQQIH